MTSLLLSARRPYVAKEFISTPDPSKKAKDRQYFVMFPDKSGNVYLLKQVPPFLRFEDKRQAYFTEKKIEPAVTLQVCDDGILEIVNHTWNPTLDQDVNSFLESDDNELSVAWFLSWGYLTPGHVQANRAAQNRVASAGTLSENDAKLKAEREFSAYMKRLKQNVEKTLNGDLVLPNSLAPANNDPKPESDDDSDQDESQDDGPQKTADPDQLSDDQLPSKKELLAKCKEKSIPATNSWTRRQMYNALIETEQATEAPVTVV